MTIFDKGKIVVVADYYIVEDKVDHCSSEILYYVKNY